MENLQMTESYELEKLNKLIQEKMEFFKKSKSEFAQKKLQKEILFLKNDILPIVLKETTLLFSEITKHLNTKILEAVQANANAIVMVIPLKESNGNTIKIATINPHRDNPIEGIDIAIETQGRQIEEIQL
ncbi:MAG: hypothetical protein VB024_07790 [Dysgonamonadaceae bacterium]|nr:hypothetical protein [Dysgonamonadaceae bacterium]